MSMLICTSCSHPLAEHDDGEAGCLEFGDFGARGDPRPCFCPCDRTALDQLYETVAERDAANAEVARLRARTHELQERHDAALKAAKQRYCQDLYQACDLWRGSVIRREDERDAALAEVAELRATATDAGALLRTIERLHGALRAAVVERDEARQQLAATEGER